MVLGNKHVSRHVVVVTCYTGHFLVPLPWGMCKIFNIRTVYQQGLTTELTANSSRITEINTLADQLVNTDNRHSDAVKKRRKEINDM